MRQSIIALGLLLLAAKASGQSYASVVARYQRTANFSGCVLVAQQGKPLYTGAAGEENRSTHTPVTVNTRFRIASLTKTFTATMVLQLCEAGKIALDATIGRYLPRYKGEGRDKVTIAHLLTYSSGIPNCEGSTGIEVYQKRMPVDSFIERYCSGKPESIPGSRFNYNNGDYILLGKIIEQVTGQSFATNLSQLILTPLGMKSTQMLASGDIIDHLAETYNRDDSTGVFYKDEPMYIESYYSAGAMYATVSDIFLFDKALFGGKLLGKAMMDVMLTPRNELGGVAYGFWVYNTTIAGSEVRVANRQGSIWGANANWTHIIDGNVVAIVLSNTNATNLVALTNDLLAEHLKK